MASLTLLRAKTRTPRTFQLKRLRALRFNSASNAQRTRLLQAHSVLACLYEVLLHADGDDTVVYAEAAHVAANLISNTVEELDSVHIGPLMAG